jgi:anti-sigma regulatory factor (Ser/Thr protein kinase)
MPIPVTAATRAALQGEPLAHADADLTGLVEPQSVARGVMRRVLAGMDDEWVEAVVLVADELVGNADQHAAAEGPMGIAVDRYGWGVAVQVSDSGSDIGAIPRDPKLPDLEELGGRGLFLVNALASAWGVQPVSSGKRVTAIFLHQLTGGCR